MSAKQTLGVGFMGYLPVSENFVSRRLPDSFVQPWRQWLQSALLASQERLGENWLSVFLVSPIWRFALSPGICGTEAWAGIMMPSVDKSGRYYPLTLAQAIDVENMTGLFLSDADWFEQLEKLALKALSQELDLDGLNQATQSLNVDEHLHRWRYERISGEDNQNIGVASAFHYEMESMEHIDTVFPDLSLNLISQLYPSYSFWAACDIKLKRSRFLCCEDLPPIETYVGFLRALPQNSGWVLRTHQLRDYGLRNKDVPEQGQPKNQSPQLAWLSHGVSVIGNKRKHNEDAMLNSPLTGIWVVADGMGGHRSGDVASRLIVESLADIKNLGNIEKQTEWVRWTLGKVNEELRRFASGLERGGVVGSTVVVMLASGKSCAVVWAGDSRLYQYRRGKLVQLTRDHTLVDEIMEAGLMSREEALSQVGSNIITRAVGGQNELELEHIDFMAEAGDRYLLCSDGLDKELSEAEILALMREGECQAIGDNLISRALTKRGRDNITVVVVECRQ